MKKKIVLKIGTSTLTMGTNRISYGKIEDIARQIKDVQKDYDVVIVSSGAIATARQFVNIEGYDNKVDSKQAMSAIGQPKLFGIFEEIFESFGLRVAQCLMTNKEFLDASARINSKNTLNKLLEFNYIPIVNENDTIAIEEIMLGDNDKLSALVACVIEADRLVIASDIDGLFDSNPKINKNAKLIEQIEDLDNLDKFVEEISSELGTGGMTSKIEAMKICKQEGIEVWILNGLRENFLLNALNGKSKFTKFKA